MILSLSLVTNWPRQSVAVLTLALAMSRIFYVDLHNSCKYLFRIWSSPLRIGNMEFLCRSENLIQFQAKIFSRLTFHPALCKAGFANMHFVQILTFIQLLTKIIFGKWILTLEPPSYGVQIDKHVLFVQIMTFYAIHSKAFLVL